MCDDASEARNKTSCATCSLVPGLLPVSGIFPAGNSAGVQPTSFSSDFLPVESVLLDVGNRRAASVKTRSRRACAETTLNKIKPVAKLVRVAPFDFGNINAAFSGEIFGEPADLIISQRGDDRRFLAETVRQVSGDVVFAAAVINFKRVRRLNASVARTKPQKQFAQTD